MTNLKNIPWLRIGAESVAIVVSILLAFAIDAWWQNRVERENERTYLLALREDLQESISLLEEYRAFQERQVEYLVALMRADGSADNPEEVRRWIDDGLFKVSSYEPQLSTMRDLESSGQTKIIREPAVRRALAVMMQRVEGFQTLKGDLLLSQQLLIDPFLVEEIDLSAVLPDNRRNSDPDLSVLGTDELRSRAAFKLNLRNDVRDALDELETAMIDALRLVENRLGDIA